MSNESYIMKVIQWGQGAGKGKGGVLKPRRRRLYFFLYVMGNDVAKSVFQKMMFVVVQRID